MNPSKRLPSGAFLLPFLFSEGTINNFPKEVALSWIESHQSIATHPKLYRLSILSGYDPDTCIAKLHRLWWWALQYAEDGDLNGYSDEEIGYGLAINKPDESKKFVASLRAAEWIDAKNNYIHDWFDYAQKYLYSKYHTWNPKKYQDIERKWKGKPEGKPKGKTKGQEKIYSDKPLVSQPNQPNIHNLPNLTKDIYGEFKNVLLTAQEKANLDEKFGTSRSTSLIENLSAYVASKGKKYSSHYATILSWERKNNGTDQGSGKGPYRESRGKSTKYAHLTTTFGGDSTEEKNE